MRPNGLKTRIFLDGGDPKETEEVISLLGFLDGQTTNPTLIAKNPEAAGRLERGEKFSEGEILDFYKGVVTKLSGIIPDGSISIEVYSDENTSPEEMVNQSLDMYSWIPNAHIKFPATKNGLAAGEIAVNKDMRVNMTLVFTQEQSAAVYAATKNANSPHQVFVSPFVGRLDDLGENGMDLIKNIVEMYKTGNHHVEILTASVRNMDHFLYALSLGSDIITAPFKILQQWGEEGMKIPDNNYIYPKGELTEIPYKYLDLNKNWEEFNINHDLTSKGIAKFSEDWNNLIDKAS